MYQTTRDIPSDVLLEDQVDIYWGKIGELQSATTGSRTFGILAKFAKCLLTIPHGNADSERMFSHINLIATDHRNKLHTTTLSACMDMKINLQTAKDCTCYEPSADVITATRKVTPGSELVSPNSS